MIYDEIDMMANPLTSELNIPNKRQKIDNISEIILLFNDIYTKILKNSDFWEEIKDNQYIKILENKNHKYINKFHDSLNSIIQSKLNYNSTNMVHKYILQNILPYLLTNVYNLNYGMPNEYPENTPVNYKFIAIPYSASDKPSYGSQFTDIYLIFFLTLLCYKIKHEQQKLRHIDKITLLHYYLMKIKLNSSKISEIIDGPIAFDIIKIKPELYYTKIKNNIVIEDDVLLFILKKNELYYNSTNNISFTDLMLHKNVPNYVSFTGTAYINPPINNSTNYNYNKYKPIKYQPINNFKNTEETIAHIIQNRLIVKNFYKDKNTETINNIKLCLLKNNIENNETNYQVLIDVGAFFIVYNNNEFIDWISELGIYDYLVYVDDKLCRIDLRTKQKLELNRPTDKKTLFYFSNKYITGIDAQKYMPNNLHGLITVSINTNLRDFAQGIFRMRDILNGQTIDIIIHEEIHNDYKTCWEADEEVTDAKANVEEAKVEAKCNKYNNIRHYLFALLLSNNNIVENNKLKVLYKQNIYALHKQYLSYYKQILYLNPLKYKSELNSLWIYDDDEQYDKIIDIDLLNINKVSNTITYVKQMKDEFSKQQGTFISICQIENQNEEKQDEEVEEKNQNHSMIFRKLESVRVRIPLNYYEIDDYKNTIIVYCSNYNSRFVDSEYKKNINEAPDIIFIIYNIKKNILFILDKNRFNHFMCCHNQDMIDNCDNIIISLFTNDVYQFNVLKQYTTITSEIIQYLVIIAKKYLLYVYVKDNDIYNLSLIENIIYESVRYKAFKNEFKHILINANNVYNKEPIDESNNLAKKYIKYKTKYMKLKINKNNLLT
jgi:hypothetical protein